MPLLDFNQYKYILFVDASGDDGYKFGKTSSEASSYSFVVSSFVTTPDELEYNKNILLKMKESINVKPEQELKSTSIKRHKFADRVYNEMAKLHGFAYSLAADKRLMLSSPDNPNGLFGDISILARECLSGITHVFPYVGLLNSELISDNDKILIVIDNMKKHEMDDIKAILSTVSYDKYDLLFRDSKDKDFPLIQIADIIAGTVRSYYEDTLPIKTHNRFCYACSMSMLGKGPRNMLGKCMEKRYKKLYLPYVTNKNFNITISLHKDTPSATTNDGHFIILPANQIFYYEYIDCHILQNRPWQTKK